MMPLRVLLALLLLQLSSFASSPDPAAEMGQHLAGVELAQSVSEISGTAISPLLGVSSVGAWRYYRTPEAQRGHLPWFCRPIAWASGFVLLSICFLKDVFGTAAPSVLKKPLDLLELFENKLSALVASSAFVPVIAAELARHAYRSDADSAMQAGRRATYAATALPIDLPAIGFTVLTILFAVSGFFVVWLACHSINVLIALSPFTTVDAGLKLLKLALLSLVTAGAFVSPWISLGICFIIVACASLVAPWAFRFALFGTVFACDTLRARLLGGNERLDFSRPRCFTARSFRGLPVRTLGRLMRIEDGELVFQYRPWLILPTRTARLPSQYVALAKGILCPVLLHRVSDEDPFTRDTLLLLPRYCTVEDAVAHQLGIVDLRDGSVVKGLKAVRTWLAEMLGLRNLSRPAPLR